MDINKKKEIADRLNKRFLIQVEYQFDEDSQGFKRKINFMEDSDNIARIEIVNMIRANFKTIQKSIGKEVDDIIISLITDIIDEHEMHTMKRNADSVWSEDGLMKGWYDENQD
jgi:hypothetical protein